MNADERLIALKRAYADIILNTAKETAARIMSSERKAVRYRHELQVAKEEALGMLLRLKQMMDFKIKEAEVRSLSQQRKIEELEAQLQEAEDIVSDLRVELREVQAELERVTSCKEKQVQNLEENNRVELQEESVVTVSNTDNTNMKHKIQGSQSYNKIIIEPQVARIQIEPQVASPDLPSIILRSKVPELYRNGCTQRIRACEGNLLDGELSVSKQVEKIKDENGYGVDEGEGICSAPIHNVADAVNPQENFQPADDLLSSWHLLGSFRRKRRRAMRNRKADDPLPKSSPDLLLNIDKTSNTGGLKAHSSAVRDCAPGEDPSQMGPSLSIDKAEPDMKLGLVEISVNERLSAETSGVLDASIEDDRAEPDMKLGLVEISVNERLSAETSGVLDASTEDALVMAKVDPSRQETRSLESLEEVPVHRTDLENVISQVVNSESKTCGGNDEVPTPLKDRVIKYTFQRKRKRETLSVPEQDAPTEKSSSKEINEEKLDGHLVPNMSSSVTESSRDSRRLAQVARQLISLSEKKWWQQ